VLIVVSVLAVLAVLFVFLDATIACSPAWHLRDAPYYRKSLARMPSASAFDLHVASLSLVGG
jgi:hypothetical protein